MTGGGEVMGDTPQGKRMSKRIFVTFPAFFTFNGDTIDGVVKQISEGGLIFCCGKRLRMNSRGVIKLNVLDTGPDASFGGVVIYELLGGKRKEIMWKYGMRFVDMDSAGTEALSRIFRYAALRESYLSNKGGEGKDAG